MTAYNTTVCATYTALSFAQVGAGIIEEGTVAGVGTYRLWGNKDLEVRLYQSATYQTVNALYATGLYYSDQITFDLTAFPYAFASIDDIKISAFSANGGFPGEISGYSLTGVSAYLYGAHFSTLGQLTAYVHGKIA
jgi:hypothetical protein